MRTMRRLLVATILGVSAMSSVGCFVPIYDADPAVRARQLIFTSEDLRNMREEWHRFWSVSYTHLTLPTIYSV